MSQHASTYRPRKIPQRRPSGKRSSLAEKFTRSGQVAQTALSWLTLVTPAAVFVLLLATNRYLAAFGQPGMSSFGDTIGFLTAVFPVLAPITALLVAFAAIPLLPRWVGGKEPHLFSDAFGWLNGDFQKAGAGFASYIVLHSPGLVAIAIVIATFYGPQPSQLWWLVLIAMLFAALIQNLRKHGRRISQWMTGELFRGILVAIFSNFVLFCWIIILGDAALDSTKPMIEGASQFKTPLFAVAIIFIFLIFHMLANAGHGVRGLIPLVMIGCLLVAAVGDQKITGFTLRVVRLGGGVPITFRTGTTNPQITRACLILAAGDLHVVWLPPLKNTGTPEQPCSWPTFNKRLTSGMASNRNNDFPRFDDVKVLKRDALIDAR